MPAGGMWVCGYSTRRGSSARSSNSSLSCSVRADALCRVWRTPGVGAVSCSSTGSGGYCAPGIIMHSLGWLSIAFITPQGRIAPAAEKKKTKKKTHSQKK